MALPTVVATDLDGTLLRSDGSVSGRTVAALRAATAAGVTVVLVTGRAPRWLAPISELLGHRGLAVCANGALIYDAARGKVVEAHLLAPEVGRQAVRALHQALPELSFAVDGAASFGYMPPYRTRWPLPADARRLSREELFGRPAAKLLVRHEAMGADALLAAAREVLGELVTCTHSSVEGLLEISAAGVSKATALDLLCRRRGVGRERVVAFGDMPNDLAMLAWAGRAVAVANAHPEVIAAVRELTASNDDDGVAVVLERMLATDG